MLTKYVSKNKILLNFEAKGYKQTLKKMLACSERANHVEIIDSIIERESLMPTALGKGVAIPRIVLDDKTGTEIILAISRKGINLNSLDRLPVKIVFLCLFSKTDTHSSILAQCLRLLNDDSIRTELFAVKTEDEVVQLIKEWEEE